MTVDFHCIGIDLEYAVVSGQLIEVVLQFPISEGRSSSIKGRELYLSDIPGRKDEGTCPK